MSMSMRWCAGGRWALEQSVARLLALRGADEAFAAAGCWRPEQSMARLLLPGAGCWRPKEQGSAQFAAGRCPDRGRRRLVEVRGGGGRRRWKIRGAKVEYA